MWRNVYSPILENGVLNDLRYAQADVAANPDWVEDYLLGGNNNHCIVLAEPLPLGTPRTDSLAVAELAVATIAG
jgi:hypothetical protein